MARKWLGMKGVLIGAVTLCVLSGSVPGALARDTTAPGTTNAQVQGTIALAQLPREAVNTLNLIAAGGPYPYEKDGIVFGNRERLLPPHRRGYYHEYTVPTPRARNRGARRIVCGGPLRRTDNCYYSDDHYTSFNRIVE
ncbi:ribonuclease [Paraburkholderia sp. D15]|uniref:ribonuclease n=1 Tax=Paraburkholderia sp. D15 TaxID=2880218 RepID=UPI002478CB04|nr:ribonuclease [Paraburkholderia sp. D15]WGS49389.1 ribonuclease [Paraburkholderia sp. D15]